MKNFFLSKFFLVILSTSHVMATETSFPSQADFPEEDIPTRKRQDRVLSLIDLCHPEVDDTLTDQGIDIAENRKQHDEENIQAKIEKDEKNFKRIKELENAHKNIEEKITERKEVIKKINSQISLLNSKEDKLQDEFFDFKKENYLLINNDPIVDKKLENISKEIEENQKNIERFNEEVHRLEEKNEDAVNYSEKLDFLIYAEVIGLEDKTTNLKHQDYLQKKYNLLGGQYNALDVSLKNHEFPSEIENESHLKEFSQDDKDGFQKYDKDSFQKWLEQKPIVLPQDNKDHHSQDKGPISFDDWVKA